MEATKFDYKTLSLKKQYAWKLCKQILKDLKGGNCTDEEIDQIIATTNARRYGYINPEEYLTADRAMIMIGVHRNQFFSLVKEHDVQCKKINGHSIGYHKSDIDRLITILQKKK